MGQIDQTCTSCHRPLSADHVLKFNDKLEPKIHCTPGATVHETAVLRAYVTLFDSYEALEIESKAQATDLKERNKALVSAQTEIENLKLGNSQLQGRQDAAVSAARAEMRGEIDAAKLAAGQAAMDCERQLKDIGEQLAFKTSRLTETEAKLVDLEILQQASAAAERIAKAAADKASLQRDTFAAALEKRDEEFRHLSAGSTSLTVRIGELEETLRRYTLRYGSLPADATVIVEEDKDVVELTTPKRASAPAQAPQPVPAPAPAKAVPPPPPMRPVLATAPTVAAPVVPPAPVPAPPSPAPVAASVECMCCDRQAELKLDIGKLSRKDGKPVKPIVLCAVDEHTNDLKAAYEGLEKVLETPPSFVEFKKLFLPITPTNP